MCDFRIFVEGSTDKVFISQYISFIKNVTIEDIDENIIQCDGRTNLWAKDEVKTKLIEAIDNGIQLLIVFDADKDAGQTKREITNELRKLLNIQPVEYALFLFPNNQDEGDFETLLERIIPEENKSILECWKKYEMCLQTFSSSSGRPITTPARKTKIYGYLEALLGDTKSEKQKIKEANREYNNKEHWNLNSYYLEPLKQFLLAGFKSQT